MKNVVWVSSIVWEHKSRYLLLRIELENVRSASTEVFEESAVAGTICLDARAKLL
jgi:hypothetical protein